MLTAASTGLAPAWPYVVGGIAAIITTIIGGWRLYQAWRTGIEEETEKKVANTKALQDNTLAAKLNSQAIAELTRRLDRWEVFTTRTEDRLDRLEVKTEALPPRRPRQPRKPPKEVP